MNHESESESEENVHDFRPQENPQDVIITSSEPSSSSFQSPNPKRVKLTETQPMLFNRFMTNTDSMTKVQTGRLNTLFGKFLIEFNIPFEAVKSRHLDQFMKEIRPAFLLSDPVTFGTKILDDIYQSTLDNVRKKTMVNCSLQLSLDQGKKKVKAFVKPMFEPSLYLSEWDSSDFDDPTKFQEAFGKLAEDSMFQYNNKIVSIVEDFISWDLDLLDVTQFPLKPYTVKSHSVYVEKVADRASDQLLSQEVESILNAFDVFLEFSSTG